jgi:hypothetical protein
MKVILAKGITVARQDAAYQARTEGQSARQSTPDYQRRPESARRSMR